jgi:hypothetical protein
MNICTQAIPKAVREANRGVVRMTGKPIAWLFPDNPQPIQETDAPTVPLGLRSRRLILAFRDELFKARVAVQ